jgi:hypothetical protein
MIPVLSVFGDYQSVSAVEGISSSEDEALPSKISLRRRKNYCTI